MNKQPSPYKLFIQALGNLHKSPTLPKLINIQGPSDYLVFKAVQSLKHKWQGQYYVMEAQELNQDKFSTLVEMQTIFEPTALYIIRQVEARNDLPRLLQQISQTEHLRNHLCLSYTGKNPPTRLAEELKRLKAFVVPCHEPSRFEINSFIQSLAKKQRLALAEPAVELLKESQGHDLFKLENEILKLGLLFPNAEKVLTAGEIAPYLGVLREDHAFEVERLLTKGDHAKTQALLAELLGRGESPIALVSVLAMHCRKALKIYDACKDGQDEKQIASQLRIPLSVVKNYHSYLRRIRPKIFRQALVQCHEADTLLKSSRVAPAQVLASVLNTFEG